MIMGCAFLLLADCDDEWILADIFQENILFQFVPRLPVAKYERIRD
jgi:hypothetical protein